MNPIWPAPSRPMPLRSIRTTMAEAIRNNRRTLLHTQLTETWTTAVGGEPPRSASQSSSQIQFTAFSAERDGIPGWDSTTDAEFYLMALSLKGG
jgi:hypothetical protein